MKRSDLMPECAKSPPSAPRSERIRVLLPLPLGPSRPISSPGTARNEIDLKISLAPRTTRRLATSSVDWLESSTVLDTTVGERLE